jgi:hypothetical protein
MELEGQWRMAFFKTDQGQLLPWGKRGRGGGR